jgi:hypothetical protein
LTHGKPYGRYRVQAAVEAEIERLRGQIDELKGPLTFSLDKTSHTERVKDVAKLKEDIEAWAPEASDLLVEPDGFAQDLADLDRALEEIETIALVSGPPPEIEHQGPGRPVPRLVTEGRGRLHGRTLSLAEYRTCREQVKKDADFGETWQATARQIADLEKLAERLSADNVQLDDDEEARRAHAEATLAAAWRELWMADSVEQFTTGDTEQDLKGAQQALYELTPKLRQPAEADLPVYRQMLVAAGDFSGVVQTVGLPRRRAATTSVPAIDYAKRADGYRKRLIQSQLILAGVALVVSIFSGLGALYFGKAWGTVTDYTVAFLWGLSTPAALTALAAALTPRANPLALPSAPTEKAATSSS